MDFEGGTVLFDPLHKRQGSHQVRSSCLKPGNESVLRDVTEQADAGPGQLDPLLRLKRAGELDQEQAGDRLRADRIRRALGFGRCNDLVSQPNGFGMRLNAGKKEDQTERKNVAGTTPT